MKQALLSRWTGETEEAFGDFFDSAPVYMFAVDGDWKLTKVSTFLADSMGYTRNQMIGRRTADFLIQGKDTHLQNSAFLDFQDKQIIEGAEYEFKRLDGSVLPMVLSAKAITDEDGNVVSALAIMYDNSEARAAQAALKAAIATAEEANKAKSRFLAAMGHEIRTPMNAILGFTQLLKMSGLDERRQSHVDAIQSAGGNLMKLLNNLLDLSQIETGHLKVEREPFDLEGFLDVTGDWWQAGAGEKGLRMLIAKDPCLPRTIITDKSRLQQVLNNFLANAVKFTDEGRITLSVEQISRTEDTARIRFEVDDTGPGMSETQVKELFRPFVQVGSDFTNASGGWGLGLSISHEIATAMGGSVGVTSQPGQGSCFFFELEVGFPPCVPTKGKTRVTKKTTVESGTKRIRSLDILVAEDNDMSRALMQDLLTDLGHRVTTVEDGELAVDAVRRHHFDLVFMDVMMPRMDGVRATKQIRQAGPVGDVPIIGCSAHIKDQKSYLSAGMDAFLPKPFEKTRLESLLVKFSSGRQAGKVSPNEI